jgi:uncharacterized protein YjiK
VDRGTGNAAVVDSLGPLETSSLAYDSRRDLLIGADSSNSSLIHIDRVTGTATNGTSIAGDDVLTGLAYDHGRDALFGIESGDTALVRIDPETGQTTALGSFDLSNPGEALAYAPDRDLLYGIDADPAALVSIDPEDGTVSVIGEHNADQIGGLTYDAETGTLYGPHLVRRGDNALLTFDLSSGNATEIGPFGGLDSFSGHEIEGLAAINAVRSRGRSRCWEPPGWGC